MNTRHRALGILFVGLTAGASLLAGPQARTDVQRTVYVTATDQAGLPVSDLAPADLTLKEGGRERQILRVEPSQARLKIALAVDELVSADGVVRQAALRFVQQLHESGDVALYLVGRRNEKRVDYTSDLGPFISAINAFPTRPQYPGNLVESLYEIARDQRSLEGRRVIVILAPEIPQVSSVTADGVLDQLRDTGAVFYAVTVVGFANSGTLQQAPGTRLEGGDLTSEVERDRVVGDGPKQSGGLTLSSARVEGFPSALARIAGDLLHQYVVTYVLPAGSRSDGRVNIVPRRKGLTVRGPNRVPER
jgi:hypothetical protein